MVLEVIDAIAGLRLEVGSCVVRIEVGQREPWGCLGVGGALS